MAKDKEGDQLDLIEDTEHPAAKEIAGAARRYSKHMKQVYRPAKEKADELKDELIQAMKAAKLTQFKKGKIFAEIRTHDDTVKVKVGDESNRDESAD